MDSSTNDVFLALQVDLFSAGITLYELTTGRRPFSGSSEAEVVIAHQFPFYYPPTLSEEMHTLLKVRSPGLFFA